ncbi:Hypothetical protein A7982_05458 [Minicystis rosea]|nr:Hypothetical protein A7982_05458 [Minicystis rosea]
MSASARVTVRELPEVSRQARAAAVIVARALGVALSEASALLAGLPVTLPRALDPAEAENVVRALREAGAGAEATIAREERGPCTVHPALEAGAGCRRCGAVVCAVCLATSEPADVCRDCARRARRARGFFRLRVSVLLVLLAGALLYAWQDVSRRRARNEWSRTLNVGLVVVRLGPVEDAAVAGLRDRARALEDILAREQRRHHGPGGPRPFAVEVLGPVDTVAKPPELADNGVLDLARYAYAKWRYTARIDAAANVEPRTLDARIYVVTRPGREQNFVEGVSEQGGRSGLIEVDLDETMIDFTLFVFAHELMHTLGATDKYDAAGATMIPIGLAEPDADPRFPQRFAEVMARTRPVAPGDERAPLSLDELRVGPTTAHEIGWTR